MAGLPLTRVCGRGPAARTHLGGTGQGFQTAGSSVAPWLPSVWEAETQKSAYVRVGSAVHPGLGGSAPPGLCSPRPESRRRGRRERLRAERRREDRTLLPGEALRPERPSRPQAALTGTPSAGPGLRRAGTPAPGRRVRRLALSNAASRPSCPWTPAVHAAPDPHQLVRKGLPDRNVPPFPAFQERTGPGGGWCLFPRFGLLTSGADVCSRRKAVSAGGCPE